MYFFQLEIVTSDTFKKNVLCPTRLHKHKDKQKMFFPSHKFGIIGLSGQTQWIILKLLWWKKGSSHNHSIFFSKSPEGFWLQGKSFQDGCLYILHLLRLHHPPSDLVWTLEWHQPLTIESRPTKATVPLQNALLELEFHGLRPLYECTRVSVINILFLTK